jgi:hypothetical protein
MVKFFFTGRSLQFSKITNKSLRNSLALLLCTAVHRCSTALATSYCKNPRVLNSFAGSCAAPPSPHPRVTLSFSLRTAFLPHSASSALERARALPVYCRPCAPVFPCPVAPPDHLRLVRLPRACTSTPALGPEVACAPPFLNAAAGDQAQAPPDPPLSSLWHIVLLFAGCLSLVSSAATGGEPPTRLPCHQPGHWPSRVRISAARLSSTPPPCSSPDWRCTAASFWSSSSPSDH